MKRILICTLSSLLFLAGCGGGGGGGASPETPKPDAAPTASRLDAITAAPTFDWRTSTSSAQGQVRLTRSDGSAWGDIRVTVSNFIDTDPTGSGAAIPAMSTDVITTTGAASQTSLATLDFGRFVVPSSTSRVLLEVFSVDSGARIGNGVVVDVDQLLAGGMAVAP